MRSFGIKFYGKSFDCLVRKIKLNWKNNFKTNVKHIKHLTPSFLDEDFNQIGRQQFDYSIGFF